MYAGNAAAMWSSLTAATSESPDAFRADLPTVVRIIGRRPGIDVAGLLAGAPGGKTVTVEDPYGSTAADVDARMLRMPVMRRRPGDRRLLAGDAARAPVDRVGRALLTRAIAAHPDRPCTLVATAAGLPLYESLGFRTVSTAHWYIRQPVVLGD